MGALSQKKPIGLIKMNIDKLQNVLLAWGQYWYHQETGAGYGSNSVTGRLCETLRTGIYSSGTAHQVADRSESIIPPQHIQAIDDVLPLLTKAEIKHLNIKYKRDYKNNKHREEVKKISNIFIDRAENRLAGSVKD